MKRILVLSDSHGNVNNMVLAVKQVRPDLIVHLGDCWSDSEKLRKKFPDIPMERVPGNCDYDQDALEKIIEVEGMKILICHGHTFNVKATYLTLEMGAKEKEVDIALFGHTHKVFYDMHNGLTIMNPGSIGSPGWGVPPSYGVLELDENTGDIQLDIEYIE